MISIVYDVRKYRKALENTVKEGDVVLELGPHLGQSTTPLLKKAKLVVSVDKGVQSKKKFQPILKRHDNLAFVQGDVRDFETVKKVLKHIKKCDVFAVDLGGGRYPDTVFKVWATWTGIFQPRDSVIRNRGLAEFVQRAKVEDEKIIKKFKDDGWMSTWGRATPYTLKKQLKEFKHYVDIHKKLA
ncbi:rRNA adenine N-6-methyltransferase family protein [Candidatus Altiarchaeota archaeon]